MSATIALVSCSSSKGPTPTPARELYTSALFRKSLAAALALTPHVYVISALHGVIELDAVIAPYDQTVADMSRGERAAWGEAAIARVAELAGGLEPRLILFAGAAYAKPLAAAAATRSWSAPLEPLAGLQIGERLRALTPAARS